MFGFGKKKSLFDINVLTSEFGLSSTEVINHRTEQGFEVKMPSSILVTGKMKCSNISELFIQNHFNSQGRSIECTLTLIYKSDVDKLIAMLNSVSKQKNYTFDSIGYHGWELPSRDILRGCMMGSSGYDFKIYSKEKVKEK